MSIGSSFKSGNAPGFEGVVSALPNKKTALIEGGRAAIPVEAESGNRLLLMLLYRSRIKRVTAALAVIVTFSVFCHLSVACVGC